MKSSEIILGVVIYYKDNKYLYDEVIMDTREEIFNFIEQRESDGALLLTGKWGCGKTYLIKEIIRENKERLKANANSDDYVIALVSLYGIDSVNSLHEEVKKAVLDAQSILSEKDNSLLSKFKKVAQPVTEALSEKSAIASTVNIALSVNPWDMIEVNKQILCFCTNVKHGVLKRLVIVFDDLERCNIAITDILGSLNYYTESKGIKTIIIANESKIYNSQYHEFKEKVISRTIHHLSNYKSIINAIIINYNETPLNNNYVNKLKSNFELICEAFQHGGYNNYRLLRRTLIDFERIYNVLNSLSINKFEELLSYTIYQFMAIYMEVKSGNYSDTNTDIIFKLSFNKYRSFTFSFIPQFIINWIVFGIIQTDIGTKDLSKIYKYIEYHKHRIETDKFLNDSQNFEYQSALFLAQKNALNHGDLLHLLKRLKERNTLFEITDNNIPYYNISCSLDKCQQPKYIDNKYVGLDVLHKAYDEVEPEAAQVIAKMEKIERLLTAKNEKNNEVISLTPFEPPSPNGVNFLSGNPLL